MRAARHVLLVLLMSLPGVVPALAQGPPAFGMPAATSAEALQGSFTAQLQVRFTQGGVEPTRRAWDQLDRMIARGVEKLRRDGPTAGRVALARANLNRVGDAMMDGAVSSGDTKVIDDVSYVTEAKCKPIRYPWCPP